MQITPRRTDATTHGTLAALLAVCVTFLACPLPRPGVDPGAEDDGEVAPGVALHGLAACEPVAGEGVLCGAVLAPDGQTPLVGAEIRWVVVEADAATADGDLEHLDSALTESDAGCFTDDAGAFACAGLDEEGPQAFSVFGAGFEIEFAADIALGEVVDVPPEDTTAEPGSGTHKYLVVLGSYDSIEQVLARVLVCGGGWGGALVPGQECPQIELAGEDWSLAWAENPNTTLTDALDLPAGSYATLEQIVEHPHAVDALSAFRGVFINCGENSGMEQNPAAVAVLREYVERGGALYTSDWSYEWVEAGWPAAVEYYDPYPTMGNVNPAQQVNVEDAGLLHWLRTEELIGPTEDHFEVDFDLGGWAVMTDTASGTTELLSADSLPSGPWDVPVAPRTTLPITVTFPAGDGCVFYTSYHNETGIGPDEVQSRVLEYLLFNRLGTCQ